MTEQPTLPKVEKLLPKGKILINRAKAPEISKGGIHLPEQYRRKLNRGQVLMVGPGIKELIGVDVLPDDVILFSAYSGNMVKINEDEKNVLLVLAADDVQLVLRGAAPADQDVEVSTEE
jgi:co-chaperonin GroES (HSP10)